MAGYILLNEIPAHTEPYSPENVLVIANGLLTGAPVSTTTRFVVSARSPLTNGYGESEAAGFWGPELKMAGYEAIVITGRAAKPVYLWIHDGQTEIRPSEHLWGKDTAIVQETIRTELGDEKIRVLQIGIAGENLVRYASITNELRHFNGRNGMGAVMGSKNLRAIAVRGFRRSNSNQQLSTFLGRQSDPAGAREPDRQCHQTFAERGNSHSRTESPQSTVHSPQRNRPDRG